MTKPLEHTQRALLEEAIAILRGIPTVNVLKARIASLEAENERQRLHLASAMTTRMQRTVTLEKVLRRTVTETPFAS